MSPSTETNLERITEHAPVADGSNVVQLSRAAAFWSAVCLPVLYAPMLFAGLTAAEVPVFMALLLGNVGALLLGHGYNAEASRPHE